MPVVWGMLAGCTTVVTQQGSGDFERHLLGWISVRGEGGDALSQPKVLEWSVLGASMGNGGAALGWLRERRISLPLDCRVAIVMQPGGRLPTHLAELIGRPDVCVASSP